MMASSDPSTMAALQQTLGTVMVGGWTGTTGDQPGSLADYVQSLGVDPSHVVAVNVGDNNQVTLYTVGALDGGG